MVLMILVLHRNVETGLCCPSQPTIAMEAGLSSAGTRKILDQLEHEGVIERSIEHGKLTNYSLHLDRIPCHSVAPSLSSTLPLSSTKQVKTQKKEKTPLGSKRKKRLPPNWTPSAKHLELAASRGVDVVHEAEQFRDHHTAKGSLFLDWDAAFRTWIRNARTYGKAKPANGSKSSEKLKVELRRGLDAVLEQYPEFPGGEPDPFRYGFALENSAQIPVWDEVLKERGLKTIAELGRFK